MLPYVSATQLPAKGCLSVIIPKLESRRLHCTAVCLPKVLWIKLPRWLNHYLKHNYIVFLAEESSNSLRYHLLTIAPIFPPTVLFNSSSPPPLHSYFPLIRMSRLSHSSVGHIHLRKGEHGALYFCKARVCNPEDFQPLHWSDIPSETERYKLFPEPYKAGLVPPSYTM